MSAFVGLKANPSQDKQISGVVVSLTDNEPMIGVSVQIVGTTTGTITDFDGRFTLDVNSGSALKFSYVGFITQEVKITNQKSLTIKLKEDTEALEEVVVVGYGVQKKKLVTGATVQMKGDAVQKLNTNNPLQALQGQTPGVNIASTSGQPGSDMKVTIRGLGTVGNSSPLYLIDGVGGDISTVNPADIESIDVLKDAASAAIYGAQAANGVVLITTKQGREGKSQVSFDAYYGVQNVVRKTNMLSSKEYQTIMDEQALNSGKAAYDWNSINSIWNTNESGERVGLYESDWIDQMFQDNAVTQSYTLGITGGSATSTYAMSMGYLSQEGIIGGADVSNYERYNFRVNSEHKLFGNFLKVGEQVGFVYKLNNGVQVGNQYNNTLRVALAASPLTPIFSDNNLYDMPYNDTSDSDWYNGEGNPYGAMMINNNNESKNAVFTGNVYAEIEPIKRLKVKSLLDTVYSSSKYRNFSPLYQFSIYSYNTDHTTVSQNTNQGLTLTWTNTATYDWKIGNHSFNALAGMECSMYEGVYVGAENGFLKDGFDSWNNAYVDNGAGKTTEIVKASGKPHDENKTVSYFARLGWNWKETYMINATVRRDGSSKFASGNRFGTFPSVSAGWTISNESFMESTQNIIDFLKIRASWGQVGNQNIDNYQYLAPIKSSNTNYVFGTVYGNEGNIWGAYPSRFANPDITWETSEQTNIGIDARFIGSRLGLNVDFYKKITKDWLVEAPILATAGTGAPFINGGDVKNTGVEIALSWNDKLGKDFSYNVGLNGAFNKNKVGAIPTEDGIIHGSTNQLYDNTPEFYRAQNGYAIGYFWGYQTAGIFQNQEQINNWIAAGNGTLQSTPQPGDVIYIDRNHDGVINEDDKTDLGNGMPDFTYGLNLGITYKNFDISVTASGSVGNKIVQSYRNHANKYANYTTAILDRWTGEGTSNKMPRVTESNINWQFSDLYVHDADFLRISNITIGYDFSKLMNCKYVSQARIYAQVQNAFTFTKYDGMDPEIGYGTDVWVSGIDLGYYPRPRTILFGVNLKF